MTASKPKRSVAWKGTERRVARAWGGDRRGPNFGRAQSDGNDAVPVSLEVTRSGRPAYTWHTKWKQCFRNAIVDGKPPVTVVAEPRQRVEEMVAIVNHGWLLEVCRKAGVIV